MLLSRSQPSEQYFKVWRENADVEQLLCFSPAQLQRSVHFVSPSLQVYVPRCLLHSSAHWQRITHAPWEQLALAARQPSSPSLAARTRLVTIRLPAELSVTGDLYQLVVDAAEMATTHAHSSSSSSPPAITPSLTWADLHSLHSSSTIGCHPNSLPSIVTRIALEGGKQGCSGARLCNIVHRHAVKSVKELKQPLDMAVMHYWWRHIRQHKHIGLYQQTDDAGTQSTSSPLVAAPSAGVEKAGQSTGKQGYRRKAEVQSTRTAQLTDDGVLLPPSNRFLIPNDSLASLSFEAALQRHPTLVAVASTTFRRTLLGLSPHTSQSTASLADDERDSGTKAASTYCALETLGKAGVVGLWQHQLSELLNLSANNMHPLLFDMRLRQQITERSDRGKNRVWLSGWLDRADREAGWRQEQEMVCEQWFAPERRNKRRKATERAVAARWDSWRTAISQAPPQFYPTTDLQREEEDGEADSSVPELQHSSIAATDSCPANLSLSDYVYRAICQSSAGLQMDDLRRLLPGQPVKSINRLMPALGESHGLLSVPDRKGRTLSYRFMTQEQYDRIKREEESGEAAEEKEQVTAAEQKVNVVSQPLMNQTMEAEDESKAEAVDRRQRVSVMPQASIPFPWMTAANRKRTMVAATSATEAEEQKEDVTDSQLSDTSPIPPAEAATARPTVAVAVVTSPPKSDRGVPLIVMHRRRTVLSLLTAAPSQLHTLHSLNRSLAVSHPPAMDKKTATRFYDAMQCDGLLTLYTFLFPRQSGKGSHPITVAGLRQNDSGGGGEAEEYERKRVAHELALMQLSDSRARDALAEAEWDNAMALSTARLQSSNKRVKLESTRSFKNSTATDVTQLPKRQRRSRQPKIEQQIKADEDKEADVRSGGVVESDDADGVPRKRDVVFEVSRLLLGFIAPQFQRVHYLHRLLWSVYQQPPLAVVKERSSPSSSPPVLCFNYADVARRMRVLDFLLLCGAVADDCSLLPFLTDQSLLDRSLDDLPDSVYSLLVTPTVFGRGAYTQLVAVLDVLKRLHLIQPLAAVEPSSSTLQSFYSLAPSFTSGMTTYDFSSPTDLEAYWTELRTLATTDKLLLARLSTWHLPASVGVRVRNKRLWRYLAVRTDSQCAQLDQFAQDAAAATSNESSAARTALLDTRQIERAAHVVNLKVSSVATYYARRLLPQLAAVHDELLAYEEKLVADKGVRVKVKREPLTNDEDERLKKRPKKTKPPPAPVVDSDDDLKAVVEPEMVQRDDQNSAIPMDEEKASAETDGSTARVARRSRGTVHAPFRDDEDERLLTLYNEWLDKRARQHDRYLPFTYTAPPHIDTALEDGLAIRFPIPSACSMSVYAASFHTFLPLLSTDGPVKKQRVADAGVVPTVQSTGEEKSIAAVTGMSDSELKQRIEYVLHDTPMTSRKQPTVEQPTNDSEDDDEDKDDDGKQPTTAEHQQQTDDLQITHVQDVSARSSVLSAFCAFASTKLDNRGGRAIRHQLERAIVRLGLPLASTAAASSVSTTGRRLLTSTPRIAASIAEDPVTASLLTMLKRVVLEPSDSYDSAVAHAVSDAYNEHQMLGLLTAMKADRWITRQKNMAGSTRSWKVGQRASELLYRDESNQQSAAQKEALRQQWMDMGLGQPTRLLTPISQLEVEAVMEGLASHDVRLPLRRREPSASKAEHSEALEAEGEALESQTESNDVAVDAIVEAGDHAARWDFNGDSITLVNTHWRLGERQATRQHAWDESHVNSVSVSEDEAETADTLLVRLLDEDDEREDIPIQQEEEEEDVDEISDQKLCNTLIDALVEAGPAGLTRSQLQSTVKDVAGLDEWNEGRHDFASSPQHSSTFGRALLRGLLHGTILALPSFDQQRFAAQCFAAFHSQVDERQQDGARDEDARWAAQCRAVASTSVSTESEYEPRALVSHTWRLLSGAVNAPLLSSLYSTLLDSVRRWPGVTEARLCALLPVLTVAEVRHVLQLLVLDDRVHARWLVSELPAQAESGKRMERVACYFPVVSQL